MSERELDVYIDRGKPVLVGRLWSRVRASRETSSFAYDASWLARADAFALAPELPLARGEIHAKRPLFDAFTDPAPDRWGQNLLRRAERARAAKEGRTPRTLFAIDFLVAVDDTTRLGALRVRDRQRSAFLASNERPIPPLIELSKLLSATERIIADRDTENDLALVLAPGTSLGGARPKASVRDRDASLLVAKFPRQEDEWPIVRWEAAAFAMAEAAGIVVPRSRLQQVARRPVLLARRFDRDGSRRIPYISGLTALTAEDGEAHSYLELAEFLRAEGGSPSADLEQLWRRIVFSIQISNTDDHLRNHGFVRDARGWRLAPAFDLNPMPLDVRPRIHALAIDESDASGSIELAHSVASYFGVAAKRAREVLAEVERAVAKWRDIAKTCGLTRTDCDRMASAFEPARGAA